MELKAFQLGLRTLTGALPYGKKLQDDEIAFLYMTLPEKVRQEVTDNMWAYAISKALQETDPDKEAPIQIRVLGHVYCRENGRANFNWGLRVDDGYLACGGDTEKIRAYEHAKYLRRVDPTALEGSREGLLEAERSGSTDNFLGF